MDSSSLIVGGFYYESYYTRDDEYENHIVKADERIMDEILETVTMNGVSDYVYTPIPFSKKIIAKLEEQGFEKLADYDGGATYRYEGLQFQWNKKTEKLRFDVQTKVAYIRYVHELQMLFKALSIKDFELRKKYFNDEIQ